MKKNAHMYGFEKYLDLVFNGFEFYVVVLVKTESGICWESKVWCSVLWLVKIAVIQQLIGLLSLPPGEGRGYDK